MTTLLMVRHGHAAGHASDHDGLSWRGIVQARRVGAWLARMERPLEAVWCGPQRVQLDSARHLVDAAAEAGRRFPAPVASAAFADLQALARAASSRAGELDLEDCACGELAAEGLESYGEFQERVRSGLAAVTNAVRPGHCLAVVSSAAATAAALQLALGLAPSHFARLERAVLHGSVTELALGDGRAELIAFNTVGHLAREELTVAAPPFASASAERSGPNCYSSDALVRTKSARKVDVQ
jgi:broad specificity phosphatase PhoE